MALDRTTVLKHYADLRRHYSGRDAVMLKADRMFNQDYAGIVDVPYEVEIYQSSTPSQIVEGFRNQIRTHEPTVDVRPFGSSKELEKQALKLQKWGYGQLRQERLRSVMDPSLQNGMDLLLRGAACKKIVVDVDKIQGNAPKRGSKAYPDWELEAMRSWPYISVALDPLTVYPAPGNRKPMLFMIEKQVRYAVDLRDQYPEWNDPKKGKKHWDDPARRVEWVEYWDVDHYIYLADGVEVQDVRDNPYKIVPYIYEWSGMGRAHADGDPRHLSIGMLTHVMGELAQEVRLKTAISVQTQMHVFPPILTVEDPKKVARQFGVGPGKVIKHPPGHPPEYMKYPPPNENFYRFLDTIEAKLQRVMSPALTGGRDSGVRYGVLQAQQIGQALTSIAPIRNTLDSMGTQTLNMMSHMAHVMDFDMSIEGTQEPVEGPVLVKGSEHKHQNFAVKFEAVDPSENDRKLLVGQAVRRAGDISRRTFWEVYAKDMVEDPDEEELRLMEEWVLTQLAESGALMQVALSDDVNQDITGNLQDLQKGVSSTIQNRTQDTVPEGASRAVQEMETLANTPGSQTIPREAVQEGNREARPSRTGLPSR
jgi:hypothetical protein